MDGAPHLLTGNELDELGPFCRPPHLRLTHSAKKCVQSLFLGQAHPNQRSIVRNVLVRLQARDWAETGGLCVPHNIQAAF